MKPRMMPVMAVCCVLIMGGKPVDGPASQPLRRGLVAHYYTDPVNWGGNWPDTVSAPKVAAADWTFREYRYSRVEPLINHRFVRDGWFSVRWKGILDPTPGRGAKRRHAGADPDRNETHDYVFEIHADDGCRLWIDGTLLIDDWRPCWEASEDAIRRSPAIRLSDGPHEIVVEYFQGQSLAKHDADPMRLYWSSTTGKVPRQVVPASHFLHAAHHAEKPER